MKISVMRRPSIPRSGAQNKRRLVAATIFCLLATGYFDFSASEELQPLSSSSTTSPAYLSTDTKGGPEEQQLVKDNIATLRNLFATINAGTLHEVVDQFAQPGFIRHDLTRSIPGVEGQQGASNFIRSLEQSLQGLTLEIVDAFGQGDKVVVHFTASGKHTGDLFGMPATGRDVRINNVNIYRLEDGRIAETWQLADGWGLLRQVQQNRSE
ncbi:MAG: hypothetical protein COA62_08600 [Rhodobiaceae bacterium]|nr:MAG: hypothetical protein COA62_08600 [Rhodobiaceae bacterium]